MPLYEYRCDGCGHEFEALQKISDEPLIHCPACEEAQLRKLVSAAGFRLKGQGWYETDFKTGNKRNLADNAAAGATKTEAAACGTGCGCH
jgi:putative FmdB family regulatory protein